MNLQSIWIHSKQLMAIWDGKRPLRDFFLRIECLDLVNLFMINKITSNCAMNLPFCHVQEIRLMDFVPSSRYVLFLFITCKIQKIVRLEANVRIYSF